MPWSIVTYPIATPAAIQGLILTMMLLQVGGSSAVAGVYIRVCDA